MKNHLNLTLVTFFLIFSFSSLYAKKIKKVTSPKSQLVLELQQKHANISHYQSSFIQTKKVSYISKPLITKGQLEFALNYGLIWEVTHPLWVKTLITDKGVIYKTTKYHKRQQVKDFQIKLIAEIMAELLTANLDKIESQFSTQAIDKGESWTINLSPKKILMKKALKLIQLKGLRIDNQIQNISKIILVDNSGNETSIELINTIISTQALDADSRKRFE